MLRLQNVFHFTKQCNFFTDKRCIMKLNDICPYCNQVTELEKIEGKDTIKVRNEDITVICSFLRCQQCGQDFDDPKSKDDSLDAAYREYRCKYNMLQPEDIRKFRDNYELTQKELSELLSWGEVTLSRYEKGKLQDTAHDTMLHLIQNPINLLDLINKKPNALGQEKRTKLINKLSTMIQLENDFENIYQNIFGAYEPNIYSGFQKLNIHKVITMILYFCYPEGQFQTKLWKLLFFTDNLHFKRHKKSITGLQYVKMPYGPVPRLSERYKSYLIENKFLDIEEMYFDENVGGENLISRQGPDLSSFSKEEKQTLMDIKKTFILFSSRKISDISHEEEGYIKTADRKFISYEYAVKLKIN